MRTGSVNRVWLMGWVARPPVIDGGRCTFVVATRDGEHIERHTVTVSGGLLRRAAELATADVVYVEGCLEHAAGAAVVAAGDLWRIAESEPVEPPPSVPVGAHASPRPHERRGHWRRVARGSRAERLVWVRATAVGN